VSAEPLFERAVVLGAGAVGSFLGARLAPALPTVLVARADHAEAIRVSGLRLSGELAETVRVDAAEAMGDPGERALIVAAVKSRSIPDAARTLASHARDDSTILCIQNGLDPDEHLRAELASCGRAGLEVVRALTSTGCNLVRPGEVEYWGGGLTFADTKEARSVARPFDLAGVPVEFATDFSSEVWRKFAVNCVANPLTAVTGARNREIVTGELAPLRHAIVEEVRACARDLGVELPADLAERIDRALASSNNRNSMLQDLARGRPTEIGELSGRVVRLSEAADRDAPASRTLGRLVRFLERRERRSGEATADERR
jgi:2-dehydropantoate 2-reductase